MNLFIYFEIGLNAQLFNNNFLKRLGCLQFLKTALGKLDECDNDGNTPGSFLHFNYCCMPIFSL